MAFNVDWSQVFEPKWLKTHTQTSWMPIVLGTVTCSPFRIIDQWMVKSSAKRSSSGSHWSKITPAFLCSLTFRAELKTKDLGFIVFVIVSDITHRVCYKPAFTKQLNLHWPSTSKKRPLFSFFEAQRNQKIHYCRITSSLPKEFAYLFSVSNNSIHHSLREKRATIKQFSLRSYEHRAEVGYKRKDFILSSKQHAGFKFVQKNKTKPCVGLAFLFSQEGGPEASKS